MSDKIRLLLQSFLMLFVELALIRWSGSNVIYLSYFSNFVLLGSFLGIGLGFLRVGRTDKDWSGYAPIGLGIFVLLISVFPVTLSKDDPSLFTFSTYTPKGPPRELMLALIFVMVAAVLMLLGEAVARTFKRLENLDAYKWDILGSISGIVGFTVVSFLRLPPLAWGIVAFAVWFVIDLGIRRATWLRIAQVAGLGVLLVVLAVESFAPHTSWSPYYKITAKPEASLGGNLKIDVNGVPHQSHQPAEFAPGKGVYDVAKPAQLSDVLVIGAGGGNDVAVALSEGAEHVDAVEIDPVLLELGKDNHPDKPYDDPRVTTHVDDGRAFLERTDKKYDLIVLALPDSITLVSGQASLRLESYLFTKEAMEAFRDHLTEAGVFTMYNYYRHDWLVDRYGNTLDEVYGDVPCFGELVPAIGEHGIALDALYASNDRASLDCPGTAQAAFWSPTVKNVPGPATDNHPFPYLHTNVLPAIYVWTLLLILIVSLVAVRVTAGPLKQMLPFADLFFMGVAFLLLETKNVVQFALLFGTTWLVNALVFAGVLTSVLVAILVSKRITFKKPQRLYAFLLLALAVAWALPPSWLLSLPLGPRFLMAVVVAFAPIFIANLVFTQRFKDTGHSVTAFGANLLGSILGGVLEYSAMIVGYRALLILAAILYGLAFAFGRKYLTGESSPAKVPASVS